MTVFILSVYHPLLLKQIPLTTMDCESKNKENKELFWEIWSEAMQEAEFEFNPIRIML